MDFWRKQYVLRAIDSFAPPHSLNISFIEPVARFLGLFSSNRDGLIGPTLPSSSRVTAKVCRCVIHHIQNLPIPESTTFFVASYSHRRTTFGGKPISPDAIRRITSGG
jgi:hypothetical protein